MTIQIQIMWALRLLGSPAGILAIASFILLLVLGLIFPKLRFVLLISAFIASTLSLDEMSFDRPLIFPLNQLRPEGRPLTIALLVLLFFSLISTSQGSRKKYFLGGAIAFFIFELITSMRLILGGHFIRGGPEILVFSLIFLTLVLALSRSLQSWQDGLGLVRALAGAGIAFAIINVLQFLAHPGNVTVNQRFMGTTGNPQHVAAYSAALMLPVLYLLIRPGGTQIARAWLAAAFAVLVAMLLWTGSRTGLLMGITGVGLLFRTRLSRLAIAGLIVSFLVIFALNFTSTFSGSQILYSRLISTQNTRSQVWTGLIQQFSADPILGTLVSSTEIDVGESSYLSVAARFGVIGLIPLIIAVVLIGKSMFRLQRIRRLLPDKMMADLVIAGIVQIFVGGFFEGFLLGTLSVEPFMIYCYLTLGAFLLEYAEQPSLESEPLHDAVPEYSELMPGGI